MGSIKAMPGGKFIAIQVYLKKQEKHQIKNRSLHLKQLEKQDKKYHKVSRRKETVNTRAEINEKKIYRDKSKYQ